jgi:hypothetical protein
MINIHIYQSLAKQLGKEECCQRKINQHALIQGFAKNSANEEVTLSGVTMNLDCCWVRLEHLVTGQGQEPTDQCQLHQAQQHSQVGFSSSA